MKQRNPIIDITILMQPHLVSAHTQLDTTTKMNSEPVPLETKG